MNVARRPLLTDLADAPGYGSDADRAEHRGEITELIEDWLRRFQDTEDAVPVLRDGGAIAATIRTPFELLSSERAPPAPRRASRAPVGGPLDMVGLPCASVGSSQLSALRPCSAPTPPVCSAICSATTTDESMISPAEA